MEDLDPSAMRPLFPGTCGSRRPLTAQDWDDQRMTFKRLYVTERKELREVMDIMKQDYGFLATYVFLWLGTSPSPIVLPNIRRHGETDIGLGRNNTKQKYRSGVSAKTSRAAR